MAALGRSAMPGLLLRDHRDRRIEDRLHPGLEQEGALDPGRPRRRRPICERAPPGRDPGSDARPEQLLEPGSPTVGSERQLGERRAIDRPAAEYARAEPADDGIADVVGLVE